MAKQRGAIILSGSLGNITFRRTKHGPIVQQKSKLTKEDFMTLPAFEGSRGTSNQFKSAAKGASLLRRTFGDALLHCCDNMVHSRLTKRLQTVIYDDKISKKGEQNLLSGDIRLVNDFWWNGNVHIRTIMANGFTVKVERKTGMVTFHIPSFIPKKALTGSVAATHYKLIASATEIDWIDNGRVAEMDSTDYMTWDRNATEPMSLVVLLKKKSKLPIVSCMAICWYKKVSGEMYELRDMRYNTAGIVGVDVV
jgi:hypothetical protein